MNANAAGETRCARRCVPTSRRSSSTCTRASELSDDQDDCSPRGSIDSLGFVELVEEVQARYAIDVKDIEITEENFGSIDAIVRYVERKRAEP